MSNGHACTVQYVMLTLLGFLKIEDLKEFRQLGSKTPGHPELFTNGIEATTGPLGQGLANAVGYAMSNIKINSPAKVYVLFGDGCYQEGISHEVFAMACHLNLTNLTFIYDDNRVTIDGYTDLSMSDDPNYRFKGYGFETYTVNGEDTAEIERVLNIEAKRPKMIIMQTRIAEGCSRADDFKTHGAPLGQAVVDELSGNFKPFALDEAVLSFYEKVSQRNLQYFESISSEAVETYDKMCQRNYEASKNILWNYKKSAKAMATREHIPGILAEFSSFFRIFGGSADLTPSTLTRNADDADFTPSNRSGNYIRFGIREHAMFAIQNGITAHGYFRSFGSTFLNFVSYGFPAVRLAALSEIPNIYLLTHDSIGLGEDGPTHQPIEILPMLRATPNLYVFRPSSGLECRFSYWFAATRKKTPTVICFSRQKVADVANNSMLDMERGAFFVIQPENYEIVILSTGSEVPIAYEAAKILSSKNIPTAVVSFLSFELFDEQADEYKATILSRCFRVSLEASSTFGWSKYAHYCIGIDTFGSSAKSDDLFEHFGLTSSKVATSIFDQYQASFGQKQ